MRIQLSDWVENTVGKEEIARNEQFLVFPQCCQKLSVDASKWVFTEERVNSLTYLADSLPHSVKYLLN